MLTSCAGLAAELYCARRSVRDAAARRDEPGAKEFVAAQERRSGCAALSRFAGGALL